MLNILRKTADGCDDGDDAGRARAENSQFVTLASHDKGVQAKEEVNFIREMMMRDAIKELQMEMRTRYVSGTVFQLTH